MKTVLLILAARNFQDVEFSKVGNVLKMRGFSVVVASLEVGTCVGKYGGTAQATVALRDVKVSDFDAVVFIGGGGAEALAGEPDALRVAQDSAENSIPLGAICIAPLVLAKAKVLSGKRATCWDSGGAQARILTTSGATFTGDTVTVDGKIVTGNGPDASEEFATALAALVE